MSDFIPNTTPQPNAYYDRFMAFLTDPEWKCLCYAVRRCLGFRKQVINQETKEETWVIKRQDRIAMSQFADGVTGSNGEQLDFGTGFGEATCRKAVASLVDLGLMIEVAGNDPKKNEGKLFTLQLDSSKVNTKKLEKRMKKWAKGNKARTEKARQALEEKRQEESDTPSCETDPLLSDNSTPPLSDNTTPLLSDNRHNIEVRNRSKKHKNNGIPSADAEAPADSIQQSLFPENEYQPDTPTENESPPSSAQPPQPWPVAWPPEPKEWKRKPSEHDLFTNAIILCMGKDYRKLDLSNRTWGEARQVSGILRKSGRKLEELEDYYHYRVNDNLRRKRKGIRTFWANDGGTLRDDLSRFLAERERSSAANILTMDLGKRGSQLSDILRKPSEEEIAAYRQASGL